VQKAVELADTIAAMCGQDIKFLAPSWVGAALHVEKWLRQGCRPDVIMAAVTKKIAKTKFPIHSIKFFEQAIAQEIADLAAPLPVAEPGPLMQRIGQVAARLTDPLPSSHCN